jgi:Tfp pilus assembly protein PilO
LAPRLEALKAKEQLKFADVQSNYDKAKEAVAVFPGLSKRMEKIETRYIQLKSMSGKIQEMAYKPFIERIKDYLLGFAAVAILLMFANLAMSRLKSIKQARDQAKKLRDTLQGKQDYPTI